MITAAPEDVIEEARLVLKSRGGDVAASLRVSDDYLKEGSWLHLIVYPIAEGISALDYVDEIESIEQELRKKFGDEILIVSAKP